MGGNAFTSILILPQTFQHTFNWYAVEALSVLFFGCAVNLDAKERAVLPRWIAVSWLAHADVATSSKTPTIQRLTLQITRTDGRIHIEYHTSSLTFGDKDSWFVRMAFSDTLKQVRQSKF